MAMSFFQQHIILHMVLNIQLQMLTALELQVIEYLTKKGYSQTRQVLEAESTYVDSSGRSPSGRPDILGNSRFMNAFNLLNGWIETNLDIYKVKLQPTFMIETNIVQVRIRSPSLASLRLFVLGDGRKVDSC
jgi:hypothetical protein